MENRWCQQMSEQEEQVLLSDVQWLAQDDEVQ
ncbi:hypothetical protein SAMN05421858_0713 [Haladaptatus litoreus]|uniref:Uncharacterized protein n=1 Tax=Haladaptatus litoreus TaxID=553468 RepID=A0A1N6WGU4_9EURY|nr:hypothetical protein SAMN05421858_0713 [Haladaptatus litoreus]